MIFGGNRGLSVSGEPVKLCIAVTLFSQEKLDLIMEDDKWTLARKKTAEKSARRTQARGHSREKVMGLGEKRRGALYNFERGNPSPRLNGKNPRR